jgi:glycine dehydrogenase
MSTSFHTTPEDAFVRRHIGINQKALKHMLQTVGATDLESLVAETVPASIRSHGPMNLPAPMTEQEMLTELGRIGDKNKVFRSYIGSGYYGTLTPGVILRNILENPGWYTQYTPYQAEIAQGRLEALLNFQTMVCDLTGMEIANASLLDESTAAAEAMLMLFANRKKTDHRKIFVSHKCFPQTRAVLETRAEPLGIEVVTGRIEDMNCNDGYFACMFQYPDGYGRVKDYAPFCKMAQEAGVATAVVADLMALVLLPSPGSWGADVVVGSAQRFGVPMGYGGPHAAFFATRDTYKRHLPGRLIGVSVDAEGKTAYRMALQTREQHIRREKATSNICTAQVLLAIMASMYAVYHGPDGLKALANRIHRRARVLDAALRALGFDQVNDLYFDTLVCSMDDESLEKIRVIAESKEINFNFLVKGQVGISVDETTSLQDLAQVVSVFGAITNGLQVDVIELDRQLGPEELPLRSDAILQHPVFNRYHSEHEILRYIKRLESKDLSLCHSMIPLGSCTMKLNASAEMMPITWSSFANIHPLAPTSQSIGYQQIFAELRQYLREVTGFADVSLQPNSGAQGEYTGLMVIRAYHRARGDMHRNIALIPSSAHGTNPASAVMAGMQVVVVACDAQGNVDVDDLREKALLHSHALSCLMVTYPSTHGVFEDQIQEICNIVHENGGQVYMDGANMNAQVGLTSPALIGADVCHLNLHKTFCIPHGGGGPGMGPIGVAAQLAPYLPSHPVVSCGGPEGIGPVSAAPYGSASILLISYAYIRMMGAQGLTEATRYAILNANYIKNRLEGSYGVLYTNANNRCAHEMILDMRPFKTSAGVEVEDIAKRLMDYGFHAPTVSFPVAGTMMVEPTESESLEELDRFCEAMLAIRREIAAIENGAADRADNPLKNAPHTARVLVAETWNRPYSRQEAVYPATWSEQNKFWPSVARVDNTYGDRNLVCACPPLESYAV